MGFGNLSEYGKLIAEATVGSGASLTSAIDSGGRTLSTIQMPSAWTAANLTFQASADGQTFYDLFLDSDEMVVGASAQRTVGLSESQRDVFSGLTSFKIRSGTSATAVEQEADRTLKLIFKK